MEKRFIILFMLEEKALSETPQRSYRELTKDAVEDEHDWEDYFLIDWDEMEPRSPLETSGCGCFGAECDDLITDEDSD